MKDNMIVFIGPCGRGRIPKDGAAGKNYHFLNHLRKIRDNVKVVDTSQWKKRPWVLLSLLWYILLYKRAKFVLSADNLSSYRTIFFFSRLYKHRFLIYWLIGGSMPNWIREGKVKKTPFRAVDWFVVEGMKMKQTMAEIGFKENVVYVPNFKKVDNIPEQTLHNHKPVRFVFLSRIIPEKGCLTILDAARQLKEKLVSSFTIDFYGPIEESFREEFHKRVNTLENVNYKGFLDLSQWNNYKTLEEYDVMLFPTYWHGEGFPGIIIDAYIAGLPIVASDWSLNSEIIEDGKTGFIIPPQNSDALTTQMEYLISNAEILTEMSVNCRERARFYDVKQVVSEKLLASLGI